MYIYTLHNKKKKYWEAEENIIFHRIILIFSTWRQIQFISVGQSCLTLCSPIDCSMPEFPLHHQLPELTQTHVY